MSKKSPEPAGMPKKSEDGGPDDYEADNALRDIERYHEHKANPDMMERVKKKAGRKLKSLTGLTQDLGAMDEEPATPKIKSVGDIKSFTQKKYGKA